MTAKEKAEELVNYFYGLIGVWSKAKNCALKIANDIIEEHLFDGTNSYVRKRINYWHDVKEEIKQL